MGSLGDGWVDLREISIWVCLKISYSKFRWMIIMFNSFSIFSLLNGLLVAVSPIFKPRDFPAWDWTAHKDRPGAASS
jgi:hypothetical protein